MPGSTSSGRRSTACARRPARSRSRADRRDPPARVHLDPAVGLVPRPAGRERRQDPGPEGERRSVGERDGHRRMLHAPRATALWHNAGVDADFDRLPTERLVIRRFAAADARAFARYRSLPEVARYQSWEAPYPIDGHARSSTGCRRITPTSPASGTSSRSRRATTPPADRRLRVHGPGIRAGHRRHRLHLRPRLPGRGICHGGRRRAVRYLFEDRAKHKVTPTATRGTTARGASSSASGSRARPIPRGFRDGDGWGDAYVYGLLADEWRERSTVGA